MGARIKVPPTGVTKLWAMKPLTGVIEARIKVPQKEVKI